MELGLLPKANNAQVNQRMAAEIMGVTVRTFRRLEGTVFPPGRLVGSEVVYLAGDLRQVDLVALGHVQARGRAVRKGRKKK